MKSSTKKHRDAEAARKKLYPVVVERDGSSCIVCGSPAQAVHEIMPRSRWGGRSDAPFSLENMCCICNSCHTWGNTVPGRNALYAIMNYLYGYETQYVISDADWFLRNRHRGLTWLADETEKFVTEE